MCEGPERVVMGEIGSEGKGRSKPKARSKGRAKKQVFSVVKAVKLNARERVGSPPPERVLPDPKQKAEGKPRFKETLADLLASAPEL